MPSSTSVVTRLSFGLVVSKSSDVLGRFDALADWLRIHAELDLESRAAPTYKELVAGVRVGTTDIAWLPPVAHAWLAERVTPIGGIVRRGEATFYAALVVRDDSKLRTVSDLKKVRAGWVDPWSAAGYVVPRLELSKAGLDPRVAFEEETFLGSHEEALRALGRGDVDVVGTFARSDEAWEVEGVKVRTLATFGAIPPDVIAARRNLGPRELALAVSAFRAARCDETGRALLRGVFDSDELRETVDPGHEALRRAYERGIADGLFD
jgi:phosphate/phosphite/phosphonate ABC transporter binding protein